MDATTSIETHRVEAAENARLLGRVRELEDKLHRERSRSKGLERGLSALSERVVALRKDSQQQRSSQHR
jgi:hypothetical protein